MSDDAMNEHELRELAQQHRGEVVEGSGRALEGRRLDQVVSVRLSPELIAELRDIADQRGVTVSDLLREGADLVVARMRSGPGWYQVVTYGSFVGAGSNGITTSPGLTPRTESSLREKKRVPAQ